MSGGNTIGAPVEPKEGGVFQQSKLFLKYSPLSIILVGSHLFLCKPNPP